jgi:hypothetical protein
VLVDEADWVGVAGGGAETDAAALDDVVGGGTGEAERTGAEVLAEAVAGRLPDGVVREDEVIATGWDAGWRPVVGVAPDIADGTGPLVGGGCKGGREQEGAEPGGGPSDRSTVNAHGEMGRQSLPQRGIRNGDWAVTDFV